MKKKVGIMFNSELYKKVKVYCAERGYTISEFIENAVDIYLTRMEVIEEELKRRRLEDLVEDKYSEIVKESIDTYYIGQGEE